MRIIAGKYRGRNIGALKGEATRPTLDRVRENLFNILSARISGAKVLDLFAGTGAIGLEALSRGASDVVFCDQSREAVGMVRANLRTLGENRRVICADYREALRTLGSEKFDLVYLDPPYEFTPDLAVVASVLDKGGRIIYEHASASAVILPKKGLKVVDERKYGIARLTMIEVDDE